MILTFTGIIYYLSKNGFYPEVMRYEGGAWVPQGYSNFSFLSLAGTIMCSVFIVPFVFRPIDAIGNFMKYSLGLISYMFMIPTFINVMQIYSMCNLHDISWGNRPATQQGVEAVTADKKKQEVLRTEYQVYRANILFLWVVVNLLFALTSTGLAGLTQTNTVNEGFTFLDGLAMFIASLVFFKVFFGALYILTW